MKSCSLRTYDAVSYLHHIIRGGELGEPGEPDGSPLFWEMICNFQICKVIVCKTNGSKIMTYLLFGKRIHRMKVKSYICNDLHLCL